MNRPFIEELAEALVTGNENKLDELSAHRSAEAVSVRAIVSTTSDAAASFNFDAGELFREAPFLAPIIKGPRYFIISAEASLLARLNNGHSLVPLDWTVSFDSNVAEKIRGYINHANIDSANLDRVVKFLNLKRRFSLQADFVPFIMENCRHSREDQGNERPLHSIASFKALDFIDWAEFGKHPEKPRLRKSYNELLLEAEDVLNSFVQSDEVKLREHQAMFARALLLEFAIKLNAPGGFDKTKVMTDLVDFSVSELGKFASYELSSVWDYLFNRQLSGFFGPIRGMSKRVLADVSGMAWDLTHVRTLELWAANSQFGTFLLPIFVSFDARFLELVRRKAADILLVDDKTKTLQVLRNDEYRFQSAMNDLIPALASETFDPKNVEARRRSDLDVRKIQDLIDEREEMLRVMLKSRYEK